MAYSVQPEQRLARNRILMTLRYGARIADITEQSKVESKEDTRRERYSSTRTITRRRMVVKIP